MHNSFLEWQCNADHHDCGKNTDAFVPGCLLPRMPHLAAECPTRSEEFTFHRTFCARQSQDLHSRTIPCPRLREICVLCRPPNESLWGASLCLAAWLRSGFWIVLKQSVFRCKSKRAWHWMRLLHGIYLIDTRVSSNTKTWFSMFQQMIDEIRHQKNHSGPSVF